MAATSVRKEDENRNRLATDVCRCVPQFRCEVMQTFPRDNDLGHTLLVFMGCSVPAKPVTRSTEGL